MPTASPSMTPSTGVTDDMSTTPENASAPATPTPTPISDDSSGTSAGSRRASMTIRTIAAMMTPMISPGPMSPSIDAGDLGGVVDRDAGDAWRRRARSARMP